LELQESRQAAACHALPVIEKRATVKAVERQMKAAKVGSRVMRRSDTAALLSGLGFRLTFKNVAGNRLRPLRPLR